jgi:putative lipoic acid-binding regulatory protein
MSNYAKKESLIKFPCEFPIKVMGPAGFDFEGKIVALVRKYAPNLGEAAVETRLSRDGTYQSITITIQATSQKQLDGIYRELSRDKEVILAM